MDTQLAFKDFSAFLADHEDDTSAPRTIPGPNGSTIVEVFYQLGERTYIKYFTVRNNRAIAATCRREMVDHFHNTYRTLNP